VAWSAVDADATSFDLFGDAHRSVVVGGEHTGVETEIAAVRQFDCFLFARHFRHCCDRTELLFVDESGIVGEVGDQRRCDELAVAFATSDQIGTFLDGVVDQFHHPVSLVFGDERTNRCVGIEQVACFPVAEFGFEAVDDLIVNIFVYEHTRDGRTALAGVFERTCRTARGNVVNVCIREHDCRGVSA